MGRLPRPVSFLLALLWITLPLNFLAGVAAAKDGVTPAAVTTYTFYTAYETPIKEIVEDRIREAFARLNLKAELVYTPSSQRALILANQEGDGDAGRVTNIKDIAPVNTTNLIVVPEPIMLMELAVYSKKFSFPVTGWQSLARYHNGARIGAKILEENIPGQRTFLPTTVQLVHMLDAGRIDTMVEWRCIADHAIRSVGAKGIRQLTPLLKVQPFHLCLHKKHQALVPRLNEVLRQMDEEGLLGAAAKEFVFYTGVQDPVKEILEKRLQEAFRRAGNLKLKMVYTGSAQRALLMANDEGAGDAARVGNIKEIAPEDSDNLLLIPEPINDIRFYVYTRDKELEVQGYGDLEGLRNGFRLGAKILEKNIPGQRTMLPESERLLQMLNDGRLDTVIEWDHVVDGFIKRHNYTGIRKLKPPLIHLPTYPLIHKKHQGLVPNIVKALQEMKTDGTFDRIEKDVINK